MSVRISARQRTYSNGIPLSEDLRKLLVKKLQYFGACNLTGKIPCGVVMRVAKDLHLSNTSVKKIWKHFVENKNVSVARC